MKRIHILIAVAVVLVVAGLYLASPFWAVQSLRNAARDQDRDKLEQLVDFPSVRESMKAQMKAKMLKSFQEDPEMQGNPFAGLAMAMAPMMIDGMIDSFVTPEAMTAIMEKGKPGPFAEEPAATPTTATEDVEVEQAYSDLNTFNVSIKDKADAASGSTALVFKRTGLFGWQLKRIDLPLEDLPA
jgi:nitrogen fixation-related uncharacterized protein